MTTEVRTPDVSLRRLVTLAWPLALHGLITVAVASNDVFLLGRESATVLASAAAATSLLALAAAALTTIGIATQVEASRAFGAGDEARARRAVESTIRAVAVLGAVPLVVGWFGAPWLVAAVGGTAIDPEVAGTYLRIVLLGLPFAVLAAVLRAYATAAGKTRVVLVATMTTAGLDVAASLIGREIAGWYGVAAGTVLGYAAGAAVLVGWSSRLPAARRPRWGRRTGGAERAMLRLGWPEMAFGALSSGSSVVVVIVLASSAPAVLAANRVLDVQVSLAWVLLAAVGQALLTVLGEAHGAGRPDLAGRAIRSGGFLLGAAAVVLFVAGSVVAVPLVDLAAGAPAAALVGWLAWAAWAQVLWQAGCILALTVCRSHRDTRTGLLASIVGEYAVFLPVGLWLCRANDWGLAGVMVAHHLFWFTFVAIALCRAVRVLRTAEPSLVVARTA